MGSVANATDVGIRALPTTIIIGPKGQVLRTVMGASPWGADTFSDSILASMRPKAIRKD